MSLIRHLRWLLGRLMLQLRVRLRLRLRLRRLQRVRGPHMPPVVSVVFV
jgi:hypothetical protein